MGVTATNAGQTAIAKLLRNAVGDYSEAIDSAHRIDLTATIDELGSQTLRFSHQVEPLRWLLTTDTATLRLIDESDHAEPVVIERYALGRPLERDIVGEAEVSAGLALSAPGALFSARYRKRRYVVLASIADAAPLHSLADLKLDQHLVWPPDRTQAVLSLINAIKLWRRARPVGRQALLRKATTLHRLHSALMGVACGKDFASLLEEPNDQNLVQAQRRLPGGFGLRMRTPDWIGEDREQALARFHDYAKLYQVSADMQQCNLALGLAFSPEHLKFKPRDTALALLTTTLTNTALVRGAFLAKARASSLPSDLLAQAG
jgi:hypothetical protein